MIVSLFSRMSLYEQLQCKINLDGFSPKDSDVPEMAQNILDCYDAELEETEREYFFVSNSRIDDIIAFVKASGGYTLFDFVV